MCDAHANEASREFDLKQEGRSRKKRRSCPRKTHFIGNQHLRKYFMLILIDYSKVNLYVWVLPRFYDHPHDSFEDVLSGKAGYIRIAYHSYTSAASHFLLTKINPNANSDKFSLQNNTVSCVQKYFITFCYIFEKQSFEFVWPC